MTLRHRPHTRETSLWVFGLGPVDMDPLSASETSESLRIKKTGMKRVRRCKTKGRAATVPGVSAAYLQPQWLLPSTQYLQTLTGWSRAPEKARSPSSPPGVEPRKSPLYIRKGKRGQREEGIKTLLGTQNGSEIAYFVKIIFIICIY